MDSSNSNNKKFCIDCGKKYSVCKNRCQQCYKKFNKKECVVCGKLSIIVKQGRCRNCNFKLSEPKKCPNCDVLHKYTTILCQPCHENQIRDKLPKKKCECGHPDCNEMIPIITREGKPMKFAHWHTPVGELNYNYKTGVCKREGDYSIRSVNGKNKLDHRCVYEEYYNCCLLPWIEIHHKNGIKNDNKIENLQPMTKSEHRTLEKTGKKYRFIDMSGFRCSICDSDKTYIQKNGRPDWRTDGKGNRLCTGCYHKLYKSRKNKSL